MKPFLMGLLLIVAAGCSSSKPSWKPDGQVAGMVPVSALEGPLNAAGAAYGVGNAGTLLVGLDRAAVARANAGRTAFPLVGVVTNDYDADGAITPPYRRELVPVYGTVTNALNFGQAQAPAATGIDAQALLGALATLQARGKTAEAAALVTTAGNPWDQLDTSGLTKKQLDALNELRKLSSGQP